MIVYACLAVLVARLFAKWYYDPLRHVPTVGGLSFPLLSYLAAVKFARSPHDVLQQGYEKYHGSAFKVALPNRWLVVVSGLDGVEDIRKRPDSDLSVSAGSNEQLQREVILGIKPQHEARWHVDVIKTSFTQNLPFILPDLLDELPLAVQSNFPCTSGWIVVNVRPALENIVARLSTRVYVGLPLSRCGAYLDAAVQFTQARMKDANIVKFVPHILRPIAARLLNKTPSALLEGRALIEPIIRARRTDMDRYGNDWRDRPNDLLQLYMEEAREEGTSDQQVAEKLFVTNFASIHTSSSSMTNALCDLAANPEYLDPLRADVEEAITSDGWTKSANRQDVERRQFPPRVTTLTHVALTRMALRDLTLVDGTFIPKGTLVAAAASPVHRDQKYYSDAHVFDPFRFSRARGELGVSAAQAFTHTSAKWLAFGHGKHACPGRFFAADKLKALMAYILMNYDIKADDTDEAFCRSASSPASGGTGMASASGKIMVRKRESK